jgi:hypothetical protein
MRSKETKKVIIMTNTTKTPDQKADSYTSQLIKNQPEIDPKFARAMACYMVINNINRPKQARMVVFMAGESGAETFEKQLAEM